MIILIFALERRGKWYFYLRFKFCTRVWQPTRLMAASRLLLLGAMGYRMWFHHAVFPIVFTDNPSWQVKWGLLFLFTADVHTAYVISRIFNPNIQAWYLEISRLNVTFFSKCFDFVSAMDLMGTALQVAVSLFALLVTFGTSVHLLVLTWIRVLWKSVVHAGSTRVTPLEEDSTTMDVQGDQAITLDNR